MQRLRAAGRKVQLGRRADQGHAKIAGEALQQRRGVYERQLQLQIRRQLGRRHLEAQSRGQACAAGHEYTSYSGIVMSSAYC